MNKINHHKPRENGELGCNKTACGNFGYDNNPHQKNTKIGRLSVEQYGIAVGLVNAGVHQTQVRRRIH